MLNPWHWLPASRDVNTITCCLQVRSQTLHLLQVLPSGCFALVQRLGKWCHEDDELLVSIAHDQERRWREAQPQVGLTATQGGLATGVCNCNAGLDLEVTTHGIKIDMVQGTVSDLWGQVSAAIV